VQGRCKSGGWVGDYLNEFLTGGGEEYPLNKIRLTADLKT